MDIISEHGTAPLGSEEDGIIPQDSASPFGPYDDLSPRAINATRRARAQVSMSLLNKKLALEDELRRAKYELKCLELNEQLMLMEAEEEAIEAVEAEEAGLIPPASTTTDSSSSAITRPPPGLPAPPVTTISAVHATDTVGSTTDMDGTDRIPDKAVEAVEAGLISPASTSTAQSATAPSRPPPSLPAPPVITISAVHTTDVVGSATDMDSTDRDSTDSDSTTTDTTCSLDNVLDNCSDLDISSAMDTTEDTQAAPACAVCNGKHTATECCTLRELGLSDRLDRVRALHLCFVCLRPGHVSRACEADIRCEVSECQRRHATVLHGASWPSRASPDTPGAGQLHTRIVQVSAEQDSSAPPMSFPVVQSRRWFRRAARRRAVVSLHREHDSNFKPSRN